jgi:hypothetical protein
VCQVELDAGLSGIKCVVESTSTLDWKELNVSTRNPNSESNIMSA